MTDSMRVLLVGEGPVAEALTRMLAALGWEATCAGTPAESEGALPGADAMVVTSHHEDVDGPAIRAALAAGVPCVGGMGSRRTQARRREWLLGQAQAWAEDQKTATTTLPTVSARSAQ